MAKMKLNAGLDGTRENVVMELREEDTPLGHIIFDPQAVDGLIRSIGRCREGLTEPVPIELDPVFRMEVATSPSWRVAFSQEHEDGVILALRHPGLGWLITAYGQ